VLLNCCGRHEPIYLFTNPAKSEIMLISQIDENFIKSVLCSTISLSPYRSQSLYLNCSVFDVEDQDVLPVPLVSCVSKG